MTHRHRRACPDPPRQARRAVTDDDRRLLAQACVAMSEVNYDLYQWQLAVYRGDHVQIQGGAR